MRDFGTAIRAHATEKLRLHQAVRATFAVRGRSADHEKLWKGACAAFHQYTSPVDDWLRRCSFEGLADDPALRRFVFAYLEADPLYFRSGYEKQALLRNIKALDLTEPERNTIRNVILRRIRTGALREFRQFCRLIPRIETIAFRQAVRRLALAEDRNIARRAEFALSYFPAACDPPQPQRLLREGND